ncbi:MAG: hypothetical protein ACRD8Z_01590, partial [Nitrososphaeraceae archaeon]
MQYSLDSDDLESAFQHAYIPHSITFPVIKPILSNDDPASSKSLEGLLTDLPIKVRASNNPEVADSNIESDVRSIENLLNKISDSIAGQGSLEDKGFVLQASAVLLEDAIQSYELTNASSTQGGSTTFNLQNSLGLVNSSLTDFERVADSFDERRQDEIRSFYHQIQESMKNGAQFDTVASVASAIERDFTEELTLSGGSEIASEQTKYFSTIRDLLNSTIASVNDGNYKDADATAIKAYLDNFEYLEAPIEKLDADLMLDIEIEMREELRQLIRDERSPQEINSFITSILGKLDQAEDLLKNDPEYQSNLNTNTTASGASLANIQGLRQGFGTYTGEIRQMGQGDDPAKESVRNNID